MSISYNTSNQDYKVIIPASQAEILSMNEQLVPNTFQDLISSSQWRSYAPIRNHHNFSVLSHDLIHDFYFSPNYSYDRDSIVEYQQIVINGEGSGSGSCTIYWENISGEDEESQGDKFSVFTVNEPNKTLTINYSTNISDIENDLFSLFTIEDKDLNIDYNN